MMNKKGDVGDFIVLISVLLALGISIYAGIFLWGSFNEKLQNVTAVGEISGVNETLDVVTEKINFLDPMFAFFFFGFFIAILVSVAYLDTSPWFIVLAILMFILTTILGFAVSDAFTEFAETDDFSSVITSAPITYHIMGNLPFYLIGMMAVFIVVLYSVRRAQVG